MGGNSVPALSAGKPSSSLSVSRFLQVLMGFRSVYTTRYVEEYWVVFLNTHPKIESCFEAAKRQRSGMTRSGTDPRQWSG